MALNTYTALKAAIANWLNRSDLTDEIANDFIVLTEADLNSKLRVREMITETTLTIDAETVIDVPFSLAGRWSVTERADETACDEEINTYTYGVTISQSDSHITGTFSSGSFSGDKTGCTITGWGGGVEDNGYTTYAGGRLTISQDGNKMTGHADWVWEGIDPDTGQPDSCDGSSTFTFRR